ncbi:amidohydrolase family protein, partial [Corynebacterium variabile]
MNVPGDSFTIVNATIFDGHEVLDADTLTVTDGVLTAVGAGVGTEPHRIIDAAGGLVTPGFVDAHAHPVFAGVEALALDLTGAADADETLALISAALEDGGQT